MPDDSATERSIYQALMAVDEVAAALQAHVIEEHGASPENAATGGVGTNTLKLLQQARERLGEGLRIIDAERIGGADGISLRT